MKQISYPEEQTHFTDVNSCWQDIIHRIQVFFLFTHTLIAMLFYLTSVNKRAIISTNTGLLLIGPLGTNFIEISIKIQNFY